MMQRVGRGWLALVVAMILALAPASFADDEKEQTLTPEQAARAILEGDGPQQGLVAQYLEQADQATLLEVQKAIRKLAPGAVDKMRARGGGDPFATPKSPTHLINVETRLIDVPRDELFFEAIGIENNENAMAVKLLDDTEMEVILRSVEKNTRIRLVSAPRLTMYDKQRANISVVNQTSYVKDFEIEVTHDTQIANPIIEVAQEGVVIEMLPTISADKKFVNLEIDGMWAEIQKPIPERQILVGGQKLTIQTPEVAMGNSHVGATIPVGGHILVKPYLTFGEGRDKYERVALVSVNVWEVSDGFLKEMKEEAEKEMEKADDAAKDEEKAPRVRIRKKDK